MPCHLFLYFSLVNDELYICMHAYGKTSMCLSGTITCPMKATSRIMSSQLLNDTSNTHTRIGKPCWVKKPFQGHGMAWHGMKGWNLKDGCLNLNPCLHYLFCCQCPKTMAGRVLRVSVFGWWDSLFSFGEKGWEQIPAEILSC